MSETYTAQNQKRSEKARKQKMLGSRKRSEKARKKKTLGKGLETKNDRKWLGKNAVKSVIQRWRCI